MTTDAVLRIAAIERMSKFRVFRDFTWPKALPHFSRFNVVYGWNGTGKTTLSTLFRCLELGQPLPDGGEAGLALSDGRKLAVADWKNAENRPPIRVFNARISSDSVYQTGTQFHPIYVVGEENAEKQRQVEAFASERQKSQREFEDAGSAAISESRALEGKLTDKAKEIVREVNTAGENPFRRYDKACLRLDLESLDASTAAVGARSEEQRNALRVQLGATEEKAVALVTMPDASLTSLARKTQTLLDQKIVAKTLAKLTANPELAQWVSRGLTLHGTGVTTCQFCGGELTQSRVGELSDHFNDAFRIYSAQLKGLAEEIGNAEKRLAPFAAPPTVHVYPDLQETFRLVAEGLAKQSERVLQLLANARWCVTARRDAPFATPPALSFDVQEATTAEEAYRACTEAVNEILRRHNARTEKFAEERLRAQKELKNACVAEFFNGYRQAKQAKMDVDERVNSLRACVASQDAEILKLKAEIRQHSPAADDLTADLCGYLGHKELTFVAEDQGYSVQRGNGPATDLSEGEKTAIAFLHFLRSLDDESFDKRKGVVVIDDPISSLDSNSLFAAFAFMKERAQLCGQLIILTHSFPFFRQVKNWFGHLKGDDKKAVRLFQLHPSACEGQRTAVLGRLDSLLEVYDSEFNYLFRVAYQAAKSQVVDSAACYHVPNACRRLLEAYLAFRFPNLTPFGKLHDLLQSMPLPGDRRTRLLQLANTYSHTRRLDDLGDEPFCSTFASQVANDVLHLMQAEDHAHYERLEALVVTHPAPEES